MMLKRHRRALAAWCGMALLTAGIASGVANAAREPIVIVGAEGVSCTVQTVEPKQIRVIPEKPSQPVFSEAEEALARTIWGEARGCSKTEQAAVVWCVLNRVDSDLFPNTIIGVVAQDGQFDGYNPRHPLDYELLELAADVVDRWETGAEGRVLPEEYLFFEGDGKHNHFTSEWRSGKTWDWSLDSPYEEA